MNKDLWRLAGYKPAEYDCTGMQEYPNLREIGLAPDQKDNVINFEDYKK
jgi:hypothetical protein